LETILLNSGALLVALIAANVILAGLLLYGLAGVGRARRELSALLGGGRGRSDMYELLIGYRDEVRGIRADLGALQRWREELTRDLSGYVQKVGVVRFNAFEDTGSDLSFAVAILDAQLNGVVISSLYGREESRVYAKPVEAGGSRYLLTDEERRAIEEARRKMKQNPLEEK